MIQMPASIPRPSQWSLTRRSSIRSSTDEFDESAPIESRSVTSARRADVSVSWDLFDGKYAIFRQFGKTDLLNWHRWFLMWTPGIPEDATRAVRFTSKPSVQSAGYRRFKVSGQLEVRDLRGDVSESSSSETWIETFDYASPFPTYSVISGDPDIYTIQTVGGERVLNCASQDTTPVAVIRRSTPILAVRSMRVDFIIKALNPDDACTVGLGSDAGGVGFSPMREDFFDALRRPTISISSKSIPVTPMGSEALQLNKWYRLSVRILLDGSIIASIFDRLTLSLEVETSFAGPYTAPLLISDRLQFSTDQAGLTVPIQYDNIFMST